MDGRPTGYMERTRHYYRALGYKSDYVWATFPDVPFVRPRKSLSQMRIALVTTASPPDLGNRDADGVRRVWSGAVSPPPEKLFTNNLAWDKESTHTDDRESYLPIAAVSTLVAEGVVGGIAARFHGVPTEYSQKKTMEMDAPDALARVREDGADAALLCAL
jgi:D-proline reductase (dithiol) PrdB